MSTRVRKPKTLKLSINLVALALAVPLLGYGLGTISFGVLAQDVHSMFASAAIMSSASVAQNATNGLAQQLKEKEQRLTQREQAVAQLEEQTAARAKQDSSNNTLSLLSLLASVVLFILVGLNFYRDAQRDNRNTGSQNMSVDLRRVR